MMTATYSPEDNKLRLYVGRVPRDEYEALRKAGYVSTPKQDCDFVATWTPEREDLAAQYLADGEDIGDEDYSATERSADRAERFDGYRGKRAGEAGGLADRFEAGPVAFGHQNAARAERQAARHDRIRSGAVSQWSKAEYWQTRTAGVIRHALHKASASVRRSRILRLEAEQRKHDKSHADYAELFAAWAKIPTMPGADRPIAGMKDDPAAAKLAYNLAGGRCWGDYIHPRTGHKASLYSHLCTGEDRITPAEAAALWLAGQSQPKAFADTRWGTHYALRLEYERTMLANEGGTAAAEDMKAGGLWKGGLITKVNKSSATGAVVSVLVHCPPKEGGEGYNYRRRGDSIMCNVQRSGEGHYTPPTPETLARLAEVNGAKLARTQAKNATAPKLINPTKESAQRLQHVLNERTKTRHASREENFEVLEITQAQYTERSGGSYSPFQTYYLRAGGQLDRTNRVMYVDRLDRLPIVCKVRAWSKGYGYVVLIITDKPQKPLPDWTQKPAQVEPAPALIAV